MKAVAELIPQVFFDILARYVPGLVLFGSWILLLGQDDWARLLSTLVGGEFNSDNALPTATLVLLFVPFVVGYVIAPFAKAVQRGNEYGWWLPPRPSRAVYDEGQRKWRPKYSWVLSDKAAGEGYDRLRRNAPEAGALAAKIRGEFTMHNALSIAFLAIAVMAAVSGRYWWAAASGLATPVMAWRGATTEKTYNSTTRKLYDSVTENPGAALVPAPRLIWLMPEEKDHRGFWEDGKGWLKEPVSADADKLKEAEAWACKETDMRLRSDRKKHREEGEELARKLQVDAPVFVFRLHRFFWGINIARRTRGRGRGSARQGLR